jgi:hypothetical protein
MMMGGGKRGRGRGGREFKKYPYFIPNTALAEFRDP